LIREINSNHKNTAKFINLYFPKRPMPTTAEITNEYISKRRSIRECLKDGLINYSALSRKIASDSKKEKKSSKEAILIAARRFKEKVTKDSFDKKIIELFKNSNIEIKNNIVIFTLEKGIYPESLIEIEKTIKKNKSLFFAIEGAKTITVVLQANASALIAKRFKNSIIEKKEDLALITITSPGIQSLPGSINYITGLFFENMINIEEFMSCYEDTLIVVRTDEVSKVMNFLNF
jgi:hypothetical protein